ncbi:MAG: hypothetical protein RLZZ53_511 [Acidobacteriota bacterium]
MDEMTLTRITAVLLLSATALGCSGTSSQSSPTSPTQSTCTYTVSTSSFSLAGAGASATLSVTTGSTCSWTTLNNNQSFVTVSSSSPQTGSGTVSFSVSENSGDTRTGTLTVAGQTVSITQASGDPLFGNWRGTISKGTGCPASLPSSVEWTGTFRRTSLATTELVISIPSLLVVNQVLPITFNGSNISFGVQIDTLYTFLATLSSERRSLSGTFSGGGCSGTWSGSRQ